MRDCVFLWAPTSIWNKQRPEKNVRIKGCQNYRNVIYHHFGIYVTYMCSSTRTKDQTLRDRMDGWDVWDDKLQRLAPCFGDSLLRLPMAWLIVKMLENHQPKVLKVYYIYIYKPKDTKVTQTSRIPADLWWFDSYWLMASAASTLGPRKNVRNHPWMPWQLIPHRWLAAPHCLCEGYPLISIQRTVRLWIQKQEVFETNHLLSGNST